MNNSPILEPPPPFERKQTPRGLPPLGKISWLHYIGYGHFTLLLYTADFIGVRRYLYRMGKAAMLQRAAPRRTN